MIQLDTNYLIGFVAIPSPFKAHFLAWFKAGETFAVSAIAWSEFLNGPVTTDQVHDVRGILEGRIVPFGQSEAEMAAKLFNRTGRKRGTQADCFIAATAICSRTPLATQNRKDFLPFVAAGLRLA